MNKIYEHSQGTLDAIDFKALKESIDTETIEVVLGEFYDSHGLVTDYMPTCEMSAYQAKKYFGMLPNKRD